jgi:hypothetical protein
VGLRSNGGGDELACCNRLLDVLHVRACDAKEIKQKGVVVMRKATVLVLCVALFGIMTHDADACFKHGNNKWALHYAGPHNPAVNTCAYTVTDGTEGAGQVVVNAPAGPGRYDIYILALDTNGIAGTRYGLCGTGAFYFYGWTSCAYLEIPTAGWPSCGGGIAQTWVPDAPPGHVTLGILDVYVYPGLNELYICDDPRVGFAEWCDGGEPYPWCCRMTVAENPGAFGSVGFGTGGHNPTSSIPVEETSWGAVKGMYR